MNVELIDPAADDAVVYDLDLLARWQPGAPQELRVAPYPLEPTTWIEHRCLRCRETYGKQVEVCPLDGEPLDDVIVSRPFLWLG